MKAKAIISVVLLLFVGISVVALIMKKSATAPSDGQVESTDAAGQSPADRVIVYYFHGTTRCPTCLKLEEYRKRRSSSYLRMNCSPGGSSGR
jgi:hypothetical protein